MAIKIKTTNDRGMHVEVRVVRRPKWQQFIHY